MRIIICIHHIISFRIVSYHIISIIPGWFGRNGRKSTGNNGVFPIHLGSIQIPLPTPEAAAMAMGIATTVTTNPRRPMLSMPKWLGPTAAVPSTVFQATAGAPPPKWGPCWGPWGAENLRHGEHGERSCPRLSKNSNMSSNLRVVVMECVVWVAETWGEHQASAQEWIQPSLVEMRNLGWCLV